jgi:hypothetical protein
MKPNGPEEETTQSRDQISRGPARGDRGIILKAAAFIVWGLFVLYCSGFATSLGLCCADDSYRALVAKNMATGIGFATNFGTPGHVAEPKLFDREISDGPVLIAPCALLLKLAGNIEVVPGITAILMWGGILTVLLARISRHTNPSSFALGVTIFVLSIIAVFPAHFEHWYAFLGEIPAAAFLLLGHWLVAAEKFSWRTLLFAGLALGLAVEAKYLALLGTVGACVVLLIRFRNEELPLKVWLKWGTIFSLGCVIPTLAFEIYKLSQLGFDGYLHNWREFLAVLGGWVIKGSEIPLLARISERLAVTRSHFSLNITAFTILIAFAFGMTKASIKDKWLLFFGGLVVSVFTLGFYWLMFSAGWPRYLVIAMAMAYFTLCVPLFGLLKSRSRTLFAAFTCLLLVGGILRIPHLADVCDRGLFRASTDRVARAEIVRRITELRRGGPILLGGLWWAAFADVDFGLEGTANFGRLEDMSGLPGKKIILLNHWFIDGNDEQIREVRARTSATLFSSGSYELLELQ